MCDAGLATTDAPAALRPPGRGVQELNRTGAASPVSSAGMQICGRPHGKNSGVDCHFLLQGIFLTQELNPALLRCKQMLYLLSLSYVSETMYLL